MKKIIQTREIPVIGRYDVVVCGGGPAGWIAAIAAARSGAKTAMVEQFGFAGGMANLLEKTTLFRNCTVLCGDCNFCNNHFFNKLATLKNIFEIAADSRLINCKQLRHGLLRQPDGIIQDQSVNKYVTDKSKCSHH